MAEKQNCKLFKVLFSQLLNLVLIFSPKKKKKRKHTEPTIQISEMLIIMRIIK